MISQQKTDAITASSEPLPSLMIWPGTSPPHLLASETTDRFTYPAELFNDLVRQYKEQFSSTAESAKSGTRNAQDRRCWEKLGNEFADTDTQVHADFVNQANADRGWETFANCENAVVILCGGMATRFGQVVKALAEVYPGKRFLDVVMDRLYEISRLTSQTTPTVIVTGPETHRPIANYVTTNWPSGLLEGWLRLVPQRVFPRIYKDGTLADDKRIRRFYPLGHGDVFATFTDRRIDTWLADQGVRRIIMWGIDNLLAGPDPTIVGSHILDESKVTVEVVHRREGDCGGHVLQRSGRTECIEEFHLAASRSTVQSALLNTNSMIIDLDVFVEPPPLAFFAVEKSIESERVVQFERLLGEITHYQNCHFLLVPRYGTESRFAPIKTEADRKLIAPLLQRSLPEKLLKIKPDGCGRENVKNLGVQRHKP